MSKKILFLIVTLLYSLSLYAQDATTDPPADDTATGDPVIDGADATTDATTDPPAEAVAGDASDAGSDAATDDAAATEADSTASDAEADSSADDASSEEADDAEADSSDAEAEDSKDEEVEEVTIDDVAEEVTDPQELVKQDTLLRIWLEGDASFTFGIDLTAKDVNGEDSPVFGLRNDYSAKAKIRFTTSENLSYEEGDSFDSKAISGWIEIYDLDGISSGTENLSIDAQLNLGPVYINILGTDWDNYSTDGSSYEASLYHNIGDDYNDKSGLDGTNGFSLTEANDLEYPEFDGISIGIKYPDLINLRLDFATRADWAAVFNKGGNNHETPDQLDIANNTDLKPDPSDDFSDVADRFGDNNEGPKNFGHDMLLGLNFNLNAIENLYLNFALGFALGNWDKTSKSDYNVNSGILTKETMDPIFFSFEVAYNIGITDTLSVQPALNFGLLSGLDDISGSDLTTPNGMGINVAFGTRLKWGPWDGLDLFGVNEENQADGYSGLSASLSYVHYLANPKEYTISGGSLTSNKINYSNLALKFATYEEADGGLLPIIGWAFMTDIYNLAPSLQHDGSGVYQNELKETAKGVKADFGMKLNLHLDLGTIIMNPYIEYTMFENAMAHKMGIGTNLKITSLERVTFTVGWQSDRFGLSPAGMIYYGQPINDFGIFFVKTKIAF